MTARLGALADLGVDAVWLTPFYRSPQHDHGYDVADHCDVDPLFGSMADAEELLDSAHALGLKVIVDLVPNHTSIDHPWFAEALASGPGSRARERYLFRSGRAGGDAPPNNWGSMFGGPAWTRLPESDQWYLHLFDSSQPDLNWRHPDVAPMFENVLRFWLERGVDGFRIDIAHGLFKEVSLRDAAPHDPAVTVQDQPMFDQPEVHEVYRSWRRIVDEFSAPGAERMLVAEAWTQTPQALAAYLRPNELHQGFNFSWLYAPFDAAEFAGVVTSSMAAALAVGTLPTWVLENHDVVRSATRYGGGEVGLRRACAAATVMLALPGSAYLYQGQELGLPEVEVPEAARQDPAWFRMGIGRDGCRVPIPWAGQEAPFGFSEPGVRPWLEQPEAWSALTRTAQEREPASTLALYRRLVDLRETHAVSEPHELEVTVPEPGILQVRRGDLSVLLNTGTGPFPLPEGLTPVVASERWPPTTVNPSGLCPRTRRCGCADPQRVILRSSRATRRRRASR